MGGISQYIQFLKKLSSLYVYHSGGDKLDGMTELFDSTPPVIRAGLPSPRA